MTNLELGKLRAEELGLLEARPVTFTPHGWYRADDIHKLLGEGVEVLGEEDTDKSICASKWFEWSPGITDKESDHKALLIGIRPIKAESEERKLLRELVEAIDIFLEDMYGIKWAPCDPKDSCRRCKLSEALERLPKELLE